MPQTPHGEHHFAAPESVRDVVIGMSDGLTVPFALAAGLSGGLSTAIAQSGVVITAGLAEIAAGAIAMGLGGYLAARGDEDHYASELAREYHEVEVVPDREAQEIIEVFADYGVTAEESAAVMASFRRRPDDWVRFMMRFELGLEKPNPRRATQSAGTIAASYVVGGMIPLSPYFFAPSIATGLHWSIAVTLTALAVFGWVKGRFTGAPQLRSALHTLVVGGLAAGAAFLLARAVSP
ncbi:MAG TPA: VIT1/CCC1 transporter family protein [Gemmatimonadales bacterium]|jgi:VIT1/CCC1 family predicted Fe2+/Mn2+ transporter|nr:VIT1/CCC1 transporter family protein [Gemmatimonadales bacterium]